MTVEAVCHRGANALAPENTYAAAQFCIDWGAEWLEIDVNTSADGVMYVFHGPGLARTTNGTGSIHNLQSQDVDALDCGAWFAPQHAGTRIPRLDEFLPWAQDKINLFLDVKQAPLERLIELIDANGFREHCFFWFGDDRLARQFRALDADLTLKINVRSEDGLARAVREYGADIVEFGLDAQPADLITRCQRVGILSMIKYAGSRETDFSTILELAPDLANIDHADTFLRLRDQMQPP